MNTPALARPFGNSIGTHASERGGVRSIWWLLVFCAALALGLVGRWAGGWGSPLWFDETFSGVIAMQESFAGLYEWCTHELTGIAYYGPLWAWEKLAGPSDAALRAPSFAMSIAAPAIMLFYGHRDPRVRYFWALFALLWVPSWPQASEARPYAQLFLLGSAQSIFFLKAWREPRLRWALLWSSVTALAVATHYFAAPLAGLQGLALLARHRGKAIACWPALLPFAALALWMSVHLPGVLRFVSAGGTSWYRRLDITDLTTLPQILFGSWVHGVFVLVTMAVTYLLWRSRPTDSPRLGSADAALLVCGLVAYALVLALGFLQPSFQPRYLMPAMPAMLFGLALWARWAMDRDWRPVAVVVAMFAAIGAGAIRVSLAAPQDHLRWMFNLERPSAWLMEKPIEKLVFLWQGPVGEASGTPMLQDLAGFAFKRARHPVSVEIVRVAPGGDPAQALLAAAGGAPGTSFLWFASAVRVPQDPRYECRVFGGQGLEFIACRLR